MYITGYVIGYFLSNRFLFSIHDLNKGQIESLESLTHRYLKVWLGIPKGGTWALVHDSHGLGIKSIRHVYLESRSLALSNIRFFSDEDVRHALDTKEARESDWRRKFSSATFVKGLLEEVAPPAVEVEEQGLNLNSSLNASLDSSSNDDDAAANQAQTPGAVTRKVLKGKIQAGVQDRIDDFWKEKVGGYVMQGDYLAIHMEEQSCLTWKSFFMGYSSGSSQVCH